ncbi:uncharacterized protein LOC111339887 [Stylophora pistillata]|uniref:Potassium channel tetramerisation-type BTB domain-containing protein n=1 Tax=Stylophora pistillata TaxID=50429 RepID=A0A2B4RIH7_STYPI|nr:uncharacterized protein LOC111339887 [Stylophora pistillata]PFX18194.1 hypothetical protein AWC38_SpisGene17454 [Stylophora pistillata]
MSSPRELEEAFDLLNAEDFEAARKCVEGLHDVLKRMKANTVHKESKASDDVAKKFEHVHFSKILKLNVGGYLFSTSLSTMKKDPGSMLHAMFSERFNTKPDDD